eukprot:XP_001693948.1 predicted protein [Chlamydomonas reinhardtii]
MWYAAKLPVRLLQRGACGRVILTSARRSRTSPGNAGPLGRAPARVRQGFHVVGVELVQAACGVAAERLAAASAPTSDTAMAASGPGGSGSGSGRSSSGLVVVEAVHVADRGAAEGCAGLHAMPAELRPAYAGVMARALRPGGIALVLVGRREEDDEVMAAASCGSARLVSAAAAVLKVAPCWGGGGEAWGACRVLFDRLWTRVGISLGPPEEGEEGAPRPPPPDHSPGSLTAGLTGALGRGCRPQEIVLSHCNEEDDFNMREQQALTSVSLTGFTALTPALATALSAARLPGLTRLVVEFPEQYDVEAHGRGHDAHAFAAVSLLMAAGPRLRVLELVRVDHWPTLVLQALAVCSHLETLSLDMGFAEDDPNATADGAAMLRAVAAVTGLRSLTLKGGLRLTADDLQRHSPTLRCLSALTGLTHLSLQVSECYHREDSYSFETSPQGRSRWSTAFGLQRSALAAALRAMPGLRSLDCGGMQLRAKDLAALTALTCLKLGGVVLAEPGPGRLLPPEGQADGHACWLPALAALGVEELMLDLRSCSFPMAALPCLAGLPELEEVQISLRTSPCAQAPTWAMDAVRSVQALLEQKALPGQLVV